MILFPCCKINVGLDIIARRADGYHELETVMLPVEGLCDILEIVPADGEGAQYSSSGLAVDCPAQENLCMKAYNLMAARYEFKGVRIHLHKIIPFGAGMGGGSADAAFTIKGLDRLFGLGLSNEAMEKVASELGSDTAFFIKNTPQLARGRGEILSPSTVGEKLRGKTLVIIKPPLGISTAEAYSGIKPHIPTVSLSERLTADVAAWKSAISNDFEAHIFSAYPILKEIKETLYGMGALYASMSGSGSAVYGIFELPADPGRRPMFTPPADTLTDKVKERLPNMFIYQQVIV